MTSRARAHLDPVFELDLSAGVDGHALERLACLIVGLAAALEDVEDGALVYASRSVGRDRTSKDVSIVSRSCDARTYLKRLMRSDISSFVTSGYFFCSRNASMGGDGGVKETTCVVLEGCHLGGVLRTVTGIG